MRDREGAKQDLREHALALKRRELQVGTLLWHPLCHSRTTGFRG